MVKEEGIVIKNLKIGFGDYIVFKCLNCQSPVLKYA